MPLSKRIDKYSGRNDRNEIKNVDLMSRKQKRMGPVGCFGQIENIKRQSLFMVLVMKPGIGFCLGMLLGALGVFLLYRVVYFYRGILSERTIVGRQLAVIGRHTLPIYLLHYFLFLGLKLPDVGAFVDGEGRWVFSSLLTLTLTLLIAYTCVGIARLLSAIRPLHRLLLGK